MKNAMRQVFFPASRPPIHSSFFSTPSSISILSPFHLSQIFFFSIFLTSSSCCTLSVRSGEEQKKNTRGGYIRRDLSPDSRHRVQFHSGAADLNPYCGEITSWELFFLRRNVIVSFYPESPEVKKMWSRIAFRCGKNKYSGLSGRGAPHLFPFSGSLDIRHTEYEFHS